MNYDLNYFINFFSEIPENRWTEHTFFSQGLDNKKFLGFKIPNSYKVINTCCAQGHCIDEKDRSDFLCKLTLEPFKSVSRNYPKLRALLDITHDPEYGEQTTIALVNNGDHPNYNQATPKHRVLAYLYDLLSKEYDEKYPFSEEQYAKFKED
jgi:hypothetical protein